MTYFRCLISVRLLRIEAFEVVCFWCLHSCPHAFWCLHTGRLCASSRPRLLTSPVSTPFGVSTGRLYASLCLCLLTSPVSTPLSVHASQCPRLLVSPRLISQRFLLSVPSHCLRASWCLYTTQRLHAPYCRLLFSLLLMPSCLLVPQHLSVSPRLLPVECTPLAVSTPILIDVTMACIVCTSQGSGISPIQDCI